MASALTALHVAGDDTVSAIQAAARSLDSIIGKIQAKLTDQTVQRRERQILEEILTAGANGEFLDYVSAEQAFMAVQMLAFELENSSLQNDLGALGDALENDERYRPAQFARLLASMEND